MKVARSVAEILSEHTTLALECIDRLYLNVYVPVLQRAAGAAYFFRTIRGYSVPSSALMAPMTQRFVAAIKRYAERDGIDIVSFRRGERKDDRTQEYLRQWPGGEGVLYIGKAQEEGASAAHSAPPAPVRGDLRVAGRLDGDGEPLLLLRVRRRLRAVLPEVLFLLPVQREAVHQRARVPEAAIDEARHWFRAARQRHSALRGPCDDAAVGRQPDGRQDRRAAAQVAGAAAAPVFGSRPRAGHPLRHLDAAS